MFRLSQGKRLIEFSIRFRGLQSSVSMSGPVESSIRTKISSKLSPVHFDVINESYMHNVPSGAESHFKVVVVSSEFENKSLIQRHRMVNDLLSEEFENGLHALSIVVKTPSQWAESDKKLFHSEAIMNISLTNDGVTEVSEVIGDTPKSPFIVQRIDRLFSKNSTTQTFYSSTTKKTFSAQGEIDLEQDPNAVHILESVPVVKLVKQDLMAQLPVKQERKLNGSDGNQLFESINSNDVNKKHDTVDACANIKTMKAVPPDLKSEEKENSVVSKEEIDRPESSQIKDGHYFLKILDKKVKILECIASDCESNIDICNVEESKGELRSVAGKARLLITEKFNQFRGLCNKNINALESDAYPTTNEDLEGFWDMISLQFDDIIAKYEIAKLLKDNDWKMPQQKPAAKSKPLVKDLSKRSSQPLRTIQPIKPQLSKIKPNSSSIKEQIDLMKIREAGRKKIIEERRLAMKQLSNSSND